MLMIRLQRVGRKNDPSFRVVVTEKTKGPKSGSFLEIVGSYDPRKDRVQLKDNRIKHWLSHGAQPSGTVHNILVNAKIIDAPKINVTPPKKDKKKAAGEAAPSEVGEKKEESREEQKAEETPEKNADSEAKESTETKPEPHTEKDQEKAKPKEPEKPVPEKEEESQETNEENKKEGA